jgi:hypothetical protein
MNRVDLLFHGFFVWIRRTELSIVFYRKCSINMASIWFGKVKKIRPQAMTFAYGSTCCLFCGHRAHHSWQVVALMKDHTYA